MALTRPRALQTDARKQPSLEEASACAIHAVRTAELQTLDGRRVILATAPNSSAMSALVDGLGVNGRMGVVEASMDPIEVTPLQLIFGNPSIPAEH
jgi:hypothetical protein